MPDLLEAAKENLKLDTSGGVHSSSITHIKITKALFFILPVHIKL